MTKKELITLLQDPRYMRIARSMSGYVGVLEDLPFYSESRWTKPGLEKIKAFLEKFEEHFPERFPEPESEPAT